MDMTETRGESAAGRAESFTPAERAVMAAEAWAQRMKNERYVARTWARRWKAAYRRERQRRRGDESGAMYGMAVFRQEWEQMRAALVAMRDAYSATFARLFGYDWNADPDGVTLKQGDAWAQAEAALRTEPTRPRVFADLAAARAEAAEWRARYEDVAQSAQAQRWLEAARERAAMREVVDAAVAETDAEEAWAAARYPEIEVGTDSPLARMGDAKRARRVAVAALRAAREGK